MAPDSSGLNPSWRQALAVVYVLESWPEGSQGDVVSQKTEHLKKETAVLDGLTEDSGSYLNEVGFRISNMDGVLIG